jgi:PAS domain S-box-containing protein
MAGDRQGSEERRLAENRIGALEVAGSSPDRQIESGDEVARLRRELEAARENAAVCRAILESATDYAIITIDSNARVTGWNTGACNLFGWTEAEALGMDGRLTFTPEDRERVQPEAEIARALARGRAENERWHMRKDGSRFWGSGLLLPLRGTQAGGFLKIMLDRTDRREAEERQGVLLRELAHRVKNTLALILAMARQTGLSAADLAGFLDSFEGRLQALAAAHDLVSEAGWRSTSLSDLARAALAAHDEPGGGRVRISIQELPVNPAAAQSLVLAFHELATNAAKHGALSAPGGTVVVEGRVAAGSDGDELVIAWRETGGPPAVEPREPGFGTTLLEQVAAYQHNGRIAFNWRPEGLTCTLHLPLAGVVGGEVEFE